MIIKILKYVLFSIITCSFEYAKNELHFVNERSIYLERDIIKFKNNRILADADNQFDLNSFYLSTMSLADQFSDWDDDDDDNEDIKNIRNIIDSRVKKNMESNTFPNLNTGDRRAINLIYKLQKELEETKKEIDNIRNNKLAIQPIQDKRIIKKDENIPVSEHENFKQLENSENILDIENYNFEDEYNEIISSDVYKEMKSDIKSKNELKKNLINFAIIVIGFVMVIASEAWYLILLYIPQIFSIIKSHWKGFKRRIDELNNPK
ncbi:fam-b protein [Plasmodium vinckei brucechwatti]|uniref:Fam-b protein n=1 Tax=Plasmodium vinckei brucechwatti TaxID=119398 RepID=A0A6V7SK48_PLAVN|nr:fam-b protein [Plasmodium vinckei brucechwatti]